MASTASHVFGGPVRQSCLMACNGPDSDRSEKAGSLSWADYFMAMARLASLRSKDPHTRVGACIVSEDRTVVGVGYNSMPHLNRYRRCANRVDNDRVFPWRHGTGTSRREEGSKYPYVCYAVMNAIVNKTTPSLKGCTLYTTLFPTNKCAQLIIQSGISEVVYLTDKNHGDVWTVAARRLLDKAQVKYSKHDPQVSSIRLEPTNH